MDGFAHRAFEPLAFRYTMDAQPAKRNMELDPGFANGDGAWANLGLSSTGWRFIKRRRCCDSLRFLDIMSAYKIPDFCDTVKMLDLTPACGFTGRASSPTTIEGCADEGHSSGSARNSMAPLCGCSGATVPRAG